MKVSKGKQVELEKFLLFQSAKPPRHSQRDQPILPRALPGVGSRLQARGYGPPLCGSEGPAQRAEISALDLGQPGTRSFGRRVF